MLYDAERRVVFIHLPRGAGVSITRALMAQASDHVTVDLIKRHQRASDVRRVLGYAAWEAAYRFAVLRPPQQIIESDWRLTMADVDKLGPDANDVFQRDWYQRLIRVAQHRNFCTFVNEEYFQEYTGVRRGGFWQTFCVGQEGEDLGVELVRFDELNDRWPTICERAGVEPRPLPRLNGARSCPVAWTQDLRDRVARLCYKDVLLLGANNGGDAANPERDRGA